MPLISLKLCKKLTKTVKDGQKYPVPKADNFTILSHRKKQITKNEIKLKLNKFQLNSQYL